MSTVIPMHRSILGKQPTAGPVAGSAAWGEVVRYDNGERTRYAYVIRTGLADGLYRLRDIDTHEEFADELTDEHWQFHGKPNAAIARTSDHLGNTKTWTISALPKFATPEMIERMARKRHFVKFGVPGDFEGHQWGHNPDWAHR